MKGGMLPEVPIDVQMLERDIFEPTTEVKQLLP